MSKKPLFSLFLALVIVATVITPVAANGGSGELLMPAETIGVVADSHFQFIPTQCGKVTETDTHFVVGAWKILKQHAYRSWKWDGSAYQSCVIPKEIDLYTARLWGKTYKCVPEFGFCLVWPSSDD